VNRVEIKRLSVKSKPVEHFFKVLGSHLVGCVEVLKPVHREVFVFVFLLDVLIAFVLTWERFVIQLHKAAVAIGHRTPKGSILKMDCSGVASQIRRAREYQAAVVEDARADRSRGISAGVDQTGKKNHLLVLSPTLSLKRGRKRTEYAS